MARLFRIVALLAVMLMPLGMVAPAEANGSMDMAMAHCPDQAPADHPKSMIAECTMACAAALPAVDRVIDEVVPCVAVGALFAPARPLSGLHPETATPPPRRA